MTCAGAIVSTLMCLDFVTQPPALPTGFMVGVTEPNNPPECVVVSSLDCQPVSGCVHLGGVVSGCGPLSELYDLPVDPVPGEILFVSFLDQP